MFNSNFNYKTIIAIVLCIAVFAIWQRDISKKQEAYLKYKKQQEAIQKLQIKSEPIQTNENKIEKNEQVIKSADKTLAEKNEISSNKTEQEVIYKNSLYEITFSTINASIKKFTLKSYKAKENDIDLINETDPANYSYQIEYETGEKDRYFQVVSQTKEQITFSDGLVTKVYSFYPNKYYFKVESTSKENFKPVIRLSTKVENVSTSFLQPQSQSRVQTIIFNASTGVKETPFSDVKSAEVVLKDNIVKWVSQGNYYFSLSLITDKSTSGRLRISGHKEHIYSEVEINPENIIFYGYIGPKEITLLKEINRFVDSGLQFEKSLDYGWFTVLAIPMLYILQFLYSLIPNWGIAIILLTILVKILLYPLTIKTFKSMKELQRVQPEIQKIREKYKNDKETQNKEVMLLMKRSKVNPMGSCLPILLQMPIFFALYRLLAGSVELYKAPFCLWITDLSVMDHFFVLPILMGIGMFIQQKMTPTTADPVQAKIMLAMPLVFTVMMVSLPAGLNLYILINTVVSILQQLYIQKFLSSKYEANLVKRLEKGE